MWLTKRLTPGSSINHVSSKELNLIHIQILITIHSTNRHILHNDASPDNVVGDEGMNILTVVIPSNDIINDMDSVKIQLFVSLWSCTNPLTESVQRCSVAAEQLLAAEQIAEGKEKKSAAF